MPATRCKCSECFGLREYLADRGLDTRQIPAARGCAAQSLTKVEFSQMKRCDRSYTCSCDRCAKQAAALKAHRRQFPKPQPVL